MKVQDILKKTAKRDAFSTLAPLNYALKMFGLSCIYHDGVKLKYTTPIWNFLFYIIIFFIANAYSIYCKLQYDNGHTKFTFINSIQLAFLLGYIQYIAEIICVYKYGRKSSIDYFSLYDYIDTILGMPYYQQIRKSIRNICVIYILIAIIITIIELCTWIINFNWTVINISSIELLYLGIRMLAALDILANYVQVKYRLQIIGDLLENYYCHAENLPGIRKDVIYDRVWISHEVCEINMNHLKTISNGRHNVMLQLNRCFILLIEQVDFINHKYGFRILLCCSFYLLDMVLFTNLIIRLFIGTVVLGSAYIFNYLLILSTTARILSYTVMLLFGVYRCEETYRQMERIIRLIDYLLVCKKITKEMQETFKDLRGIIVSRPIVYHAFNFFRVDYTIVVSMSSVIVTYTIILLQSLQ